MNKIVTTFNVSCDSIMQAIESNKVYNLDEESDMLKKYCKDLTDLDFKKSKLLRQKTVNLNKIEEMR